MISCSKQDNHSEDKPVLYQIIPFDSLDIISVPYPRLSSNTALVRAINSMGKKHKTPPSFDYGVSVIFHISLIYG